MSKYLGQHFLKNKKKIEKIVEALDLKPNETVIEIGAGHGEITDELRSKNTELNGGLKIIIIEKDRRLIQFLKQKFQSQGTLSYRKVRKTTLGCKNEDKYKNGNKKNENKNENVKDIEILERDIEILEGDAIKIIPEIIKTYNLKPNTYKIVGNIPYYITGRLLRTMGELKRKPKLIILTIQKEVAERAVAKPPNMNLLAASVQFWAKPEIVGYISKKDFKPIPKVDSAIIKLEVKSEKRKEKSDEYYRLIKILFKQPRKTILNNLATSDKRQATSDKRQATRKEEIATKIKKTGINPNERPQNLSIQQIIQLSQIFKS